jgi:hypothetical protein
VRSLSVSEEERLKTSLLSPIKASEHLNKCIYESIVSKPEEIHTYGDFLKKLTIKDRDALLFGLYHITYGDIKNYDITCSSCRKTYAVTIKASNLFNFSPYPGEGILEKVEKIQLPVYKDVWVYIKQPSLEEEDASIKNLTGLGGASVDTVIETLIIDKFEEISPADSTTSTMVVSDKADVLRAYLQLPARDKRKIYEEYEEKFGKYGVDLKMKSYCTFCGNEDEVEVNLVAQFFRMVYQS